MNFNRRSSHGHHGSKRHELVKYAHSRGSHTFTYTLISTQLQPRCGAKRQLSYYRIWNQILFCRHFLFNVARALFIQLMLIKASEK